ncbi:hypothetical protein OROHE_015164 [Orobanche hederae]
MMKQKWEAAIYHSKDFDWDELREEVEKIQQFEFHFLPFAKVVTTFDDAQLDSGAWDQFHARHSTGKFFKWAKPLKDGGSGAAPPTAGSKGRQPLAGSKGRSPWLGGERQYLLKEFPELGSCKENSKVLEVGCGNGSTALPLLCGRESIILYACDCSNEALERTKWTIAASNSTSAIHRFHPFLCDFSTTGFPSWLAYNNHLGFSEANTDDAKSCIGVDFITLEFGGPKSGIHLCNYTRYSLCRPCHPTGFPKAIKECFSVLKPGDMLLFRDYGKNEMRFYSNSEILRFASRQHWFRILLVCHETGICDMIMLRFDPEQRVGYREYLRPDGTRAYFFCLDTVRSLTSVAGFIETK